MISAVQHTNPAGLNDPSHFGYTHVTVVQITILSVHHDAEKQQLISRERNAFWQGRQKPASTLIRVAGLAVDGMLFEIDAIAVMADA